MRLNLTVRILLILSGVAALSTLLALVLQDRTLSGDLHESTLARLEQAEESTNHLVDSYLEALHERYRAISGTPQFRATLEVGDAATLRFYAAELVEREKASLMAFIDAEGRTIAQAGDETLERAIEALPEPGLLAFEGRALAVTVIPLRTGQRLLGHLVSVESLDDRLVQRWSELCGADLFFALPGSARDDVVERVVRTLSGLELRVAVSLEVERQALNHSRLNLLAAGGVALAIVFVMSALLSNSLVWPIRQIQNATVRIGEGDFSARLLSTRSDEIGDVARAVDQMLDGLSGYRSKVERQHRELEENFERLEQSQEALASAQRLAHVGSWRLDFATGELKGSDEFRSLLELDVENKSLSVSEILELVHSGDREGLETAFHALIDEGVALTLDCRVALSETPDRALRVQARIQQDESGQPIAIEGTIQDITERKRTEEQIRYLAYHDTLTGLGNSRLCRERLAIEITKARRSENIVGVVFLGLDRFKRINDTFGYSVGDELIKSVADRLVSSVRASDFTSRNVQTSSLARLGGDEFMVVVTDPSGVQDLAKVAKRALGALSQPFELGGHEVVISGSIGISIFPNDGEDVESLIRNAHAAMDHSKAKGSDNFQFYTESMNEVALVRLILENKMRRGLERGEFELHYQPRISLETGEITSFEALMRWREPEAGVVSPGVFIPIAEESGLINALGDWAISEACRQIAAWSQMGFELPVSVNLSPHRFKAGTLATQIIEVVERSGIAPGLLELEITESTLMHNQKEVVADLEQLRAKGMRISIDDFGTGYSSFAYLKILPADALKIDQSFIADIATNADDAALCASIVSMSRALRLLVVAEGVETDEQRALLAEWGCDEMQGFLFSPALPHDQIEDHLQAPSEGWCVVKNRS